LGLSFSDMHTFFSVGELELPYYQVVFVTSIGYFLIGQTRDVNVAMEWTSYLNGGGAKPRTPLSVPNYGGLQTFKYAE
jgi:hypothetical protein